MKIPRTVLCAAWGAAVLCETAAVHAASPGGAWRQFVRPEQAGFDGAKLADVRTLAEEHESAAVFVVFRGHVLAAWGDVERPFKCHSVRKSLLSALYGPYVTDGAIDLGTTLAALGIDDEPPLTDNEKKARIVDLISARSGVYHSAAYEPQGMKARRPDRGSHPPGSHFFYNNWDFNTAGAIFEKLTGKSIFTAFKETLADPIGMEDFTLEHTFYQHEPCSSKYPAYLFRLSARDLARVGQLFLQDGQWNGKQIIPTAWVKESTSLHAGNSYGYMWWVFPKGEPGRMVPELSKYDKFAASGTGSQFMMVIPEAELVFVNRGDTDKTEDGPSVPSFKLIEMILAARTGPPRDEPQLKPLTPIPFSNATPPPPKRTEVKVNPDGFDDYVGVYESPPQFHITIHKHGEDLYALARGLGEVRLFPAAPGRFFCKFINLEISFQSGPDGRVTHADADFYGRPLHLERTQ